MIYKESEGKKTKNRKGLAAQLVARLPSINM